METSFPSYLYFNLIMIVPLIYLHPSSAAQSKQYENCRKPFRCGFLDNISYPFYDGQSRPDYCGFPGFQLKCSKVMPQMSVTSSHTEKFYLLNISPTTYSFTVAREDYWDTYCPSNISNTTINFSLFSYQDANANITLYYECSTTSTKSSNQFSCSNTSSVSSNVYFMTKNLALEYRIDKILQETCKSKVFVPAYQSAVVGVKDAVSLMPALRNGFGLQWVAENELCKDCRGSGGECGQDTRTGSFTCYCPDQPYDHKCNENGWGC